MDGTSASFSFATPSGWNENSSPPLPFLLCGGDGGIEADEHVLVIALPPFPPFFSQFRGEERRSRSGRPFSSFFISCAGKDRVVPVRLL